MLPGNFGMTVYDNSSMGKVEGRNIMKMSKATVQKEHILYRRYLRYGGSASLI